MNGTGPQDPGGPIQASADGTSSSGPLASTPPGPADASAAGEGNETGAGAPGGPKAPGKRSAKGTPKKSRSFWKELPVLIIVALILTLIIKTYFIQAFFIPSGSMQNTLAISDRVLVNKIVYDTRSIHRGDIVVFSGDGSWNPGTPPASSSFFARFGESVASMFGLAKNQNDYIKRVIGLPGDHVACCDAQGRVTVERRAAEREVLPVPG